MYVSVGSSLSGLCHYLNLVLQVSVSVSSTNMLEKLEEMRQQQAEFRSKKRELENKIKDLTLQVS